MLWEYLLESSQQLDATNRIRHVFTWPRERAKVTPKEEEKCSGAKEKEKMNKETMQKVPTMRLNSFRHFKTYILCYNTC